MIKRLAQCVREYKKPAVLSPIIVSLEVIIECIMPFMVATLVNQIKAGCGIDVIAKYGGILIVMAMMSLACGALAGHYCAIASAGFAKNIRKDLFEKIQGFSFENIDKFSTSSLVTRLTTDISNVQMAFMMLIRTAIRSPFMLIFSFTMAFVMGGKMAAIFVFTIPVMIIGLGTIIKITLPLFKRIPILYQTMQQP